LIEWSSTGNPRKIIFVDEREGKRVQDIWTHKDPQYPDYPTEKNADILDLIIKTSSIFLMFAHLCANVCLLGASYL
jgi:adenine-specific DNA-methyltransferase